MITITSLQINWDVLCGFQEGSQRTGHLLGSMEKPQAGGGQHLRTSHHLQWLHLSRPALPCGPSLSSTKAMYLSPPTFQWSLLRISTLVYCDVSFTLPDIFTKQHEFYSIFHFILFVSMTSEYVSEKHNWILNLQFKRWTDKTKIETASLYQIAIQFNSYVITWLLTVKSYWCKLRCQW